MDDCGVVTQGVRTTVLRDNKTRVTVIFGQSIENFLEAGRIYFAARRIESDAGGRSARA
jgi:hypothetical protein